MLHKEKPCFPPARLVSTASSREPISICLSTCLICFKFLFNASPMINFCDDFKRISNDFLIFVDIYRLIFCYQFFDCLECSADYCFRLDAM